MDASELKFRTVTDSNMHDVYQYVYIHAEVNSKEIMLIFSLLWKNPCEDMDRFVVFQTGTSIFTIQDQSESAVYEVLIFDCGSNYDCWLIFYFEDRDSEETFSGYQELYKKYGTGTASDGYAY